MKLLLLPVLLAPTEAALVSRGTHHGIFPTASDSTQSFLNPLGFSQKLRICNAFADKSPLDISFGNNQKMTTDSPLAYKDCRDFNSLKLHAGDKLNFQLVQDSKLSKTKTDLGSFEISSIPDNQDATLFLAIYRRDPGFSSSAVKFTSHTFSGMINAQVAAFDTFSSDTKAELDLADLGNYLNNSSYGRREKTNFDTVVAVNPGALEAQLWANGKLQKKADLYTQARENYVVLRVGAVGAGVPKGQFGEDLVIFPQTRPIVARASGVWDSLRRLFMFVA